VVMRSVRWPNLIIKGCLAQGAHLCPITPISQYTHTIVMIGSEASLNQSATSEPDIERTIPTRWYVSSWPGRTLRIITQRPSVNKLSKRVIRSPKILSPHISVRLSSLASGMNSTPCSLISRPVQSTAGSGLTYTCRRLGSDHFNLRSGPFTLMYPALT
jgi:hypothetical protein